MLKKEIAGWMVTLYFMVLSAGVMPRDALAACCGSGDGDRCCGECCTAGPGGCESGPCS